MSVTLTPMSKKLIQQKLAAEPDRTAAEVIEDALRAQDERDRFARLRAAIAVGEAQLARGEGIPYSNELIDEIERESEEAFQRGESPREDVVA